MTGLHAFNEVFFDDVRIPAGNLVGEEGRGWDLAKVTLSNERVSLSSGGVLWGNGPTTSELFDLIRKRGGMVDPTMRQRAAQLFIEGEVLRLIRLRTVSLAVHGKPPGPEASVRKALADEHGQRVMALAKDFDGAQGMLSTTDPEWHYGFLYSRALTIGGGTSEVQRNIIAERVLGLPHDVDVEAGRSWAETRKG
jgi:alkylation response protein AidB-like acyl-CoA dehydrogenase